MSFDSDMLLTRISPSLLGRMVQRYRTVLREGAWIACSQVLRVAAGFVGIRLITEYVEPSVYGVVALLLGIEVLAKSIFCQPFVNALIRFFPYAQEADQIRQLRELTMRTVLWLSLLPLLACLLAALWPATWRSVSLFGMLVLAALYYIELLRDIDLALFSAARRQRAMSIWMSTEGIIRPFIIIGTVLLFGPSVESVLVASFVAPLLPLVYALVYVERIGVNHDKGFETPRSSMSDGFFRYAVPLMPVSIMAWMTAVGDRYVIGAFLDANSLGVYVATYALVSQPFLIVGGIAVMTLRPVYLNAVSAGDATKARQVLSHWLLLVVVVSLVGVVLFTMLQDVVARILLAEEYRSGATLMPWLSLGYLFLSVQQVLENHLVAQKQSKAILLGQTIGGVSALVITIPMVANFGLLGAAIAWPMYACVLIVTVLALIYWDTLQRG